MSALACVTNDVPSDSMRAINVRACTVRGEHTVACDGWAWRLVVKVDPRTGAETVQHVATGRECSGCLPREARFGLLCAGCWHRFEAALAGWPEFTRKLTALDGAPAVKGNGGGGSSEGYVPLPGTALSVDECNRYLQGLTGDARVWVSTSEGARNAILFTRAAEVAYRAHQVEEQTRKLRRVRCPECKQLSLVRVPPHAEALPVIVTCQTDGCGKTIVEGDTTGDREKLDVIAEIEGRRA